MSRKTIFALALATLAVSAPTTAQEGGLRFDKTVPYRLDQTHSLGARVGPVIVDSVVLSIGGGGGSIRDSIMSRVRPPGSIDPEVSTTIRATFDTQNPSEDEWEITYTLDFLDADGQLIDRGTGKGSLEGEAKMVGFDHPTLTYVVASIASVRIRLEARLD
jgi:hypothetical protein